MTHTTTWGLLGGSTPDERIARLLADPAGRLVPLALQTTAGAAVYGAVIGSWRGGAMVGFAAVKLPAVLLLTAALTVAGQWILAALLGVRLPFATTSALTLHALATAAVLLAALAPVAVLFTLAAAPPGTDARTAHNVLYLMHTAAVGACGLAGTAELRRALRCLVPTPRLARRVYLSWVAVYAWVGGEVAWALRPFVGSVFLPPVFLRPDALDGNVYEFVLTDILPHLFR